MLPNGLTEAQSKELADELIRTNSIALCTEPKSLSYLCGERIPASALGLTRDKDFCISKVAGGVVYAHGKELFPTPETAATYFADPNPEKLVQTDFAKRIEFLQHHDSFPLRNKLYQKGFEEEIEAKLERLLQDSRMRRWRETLPLLYAGAWI